MAVGILLVTHHLSDIIPEINCVIFIRQGRVVADGPKREILNAPHCGSRSESKCNWPSGVVIITSGKSATTCAPL